jgi:hypothetical protein
MSTTRPLCRAIFQTSASVFQRGGTPAVRSTVKSWLPAVRFVILIRNDDLRAFLAQYDKDGGDIAVRHGGRVPKATESQNVARRPARQVADGRCANA